jgi:hypothetical protein
MRNIVGRYWSLFARKGEGCYRKTLSKHQSNGDKFVRTCIDHCLPQSLFSTVPSTAYTSDTSL